MSTTKKGDKDPRLIRSWYTLKEDFLTHKKLHKKGTKIFLTDEGATYLRNKNII